MQEVGQHLLARGMLRTLVQQHPGTTTAAATPSLREGWLEEVGRHLLVNANGGLWFQQPPRGRPQSAPSSALPSTLRERWIEEVGQHLFSVQAVVGGGDANADSSDDVSRGDSGVAVGGDAMDGFDLWTSMDGVVEEIAAQRVQTAARGHLQRKGRRTANNNSSTSATASTTTTTPSE